MKRNKIMNSFDMKYITNNLNNAKDEMSELISKIDFITDPLLLNQLIFQLKAAEMRYSYWYKLAKESYEKEPS